MADPAHPLHASFQGAWRDGDWWAVRGYDPVFGRKRPALFDRCGLAEIRHEASSEVVRGGSPWARWAAESLDVIRKLGGGAKSPVAQGEHDLIASAFADPSVWMLRELSMRAGGGGRRDGQR